MWVHSLIFVAALISVSVAYVATEEDDMNKFLEDYRAKQNDLKAAALGEELEKGILFKTDEDGVQYKIKMSPPGRQPEILILDPRLDGDKKLVFVGGPRRNKRAVTGGGLTGDNNWDKEWVKPINRLFPENWWRRYWAMKNKSDEFADTPQSPWRDY